MQHGAWPGEAGDFSSSTLAPGEADEFSISPLPPRSARWLCVQHGAWHRELPERTSANRPVREADDFSSSTLAPGGRFQHIPAAAAFPAAAGPAGSAFSRYVAW